MRYAQPFRRIASLWCRCRALPAELRAGTLPLPVLLQPGRLRASWSRLGAYRHVWVLVPGFLALVVFAVSQGMSAPAGASPTGFEAAVQQAENEAYDVAGQSAVPAAGAAAVAATPGPATPFGVANSAVLTASGIPEAAYRAYVGAAGLLARTDPGCGVGWSVLAGVGRVESNHGRFGGSVIGADGVVSPPILGIRLDGLRPGTARISDTDDGRYDGDAGLDRAVGPMQFLPGTWKAYGAGGNPQDVDAAAAAAARYLCAGSGDLRTQQGRWAAVYRYNHSDSYVSLVLSLADSYATGSPVAFPSRPGGTTTPDGEAATPAGKPAAVPVPVVTRPSSAATRSPSTAPASSTTAPPSSSTTPTTATAPPVAGSATTTTAPAPPATTVPPPTAPVVVSPSVTSTTDPAVT